MDTVSLKEYIFENKKIEYILSEIDRWRMYLKSIWTISGIY